MSGDMIALHDGTILHNVHTADRCLNRGRCCIHNPSEHPLNKAPLSWMGNDIRVMHRVCEHGFHHPDPDALLFAMLRGDGITAEAVSSVHLMDENCDGCCHTEVTS